MPACTEIKIGLHAYEHTSIYPYSMFVCVCVCVYVHICIYIIYIYIYIYILHIYIYCHLYICAYFQDNITSVHYRLPLQTPSPVNEGR